MDEEELDVEAADVRVTLTPAPDVVGTLPAPATTEPSPATTGSAANYYGFGFGQGLFALGTLVVLASGGKFSIVATAPTESANAITAPP